MSHVTEALEREGIHLKGQALAAAEELGRQVEPLTAFVDAACRGCGAPVRCMIDSESFCLAPMCGPCELSEMRARGIIP